MSSRQASFADVAEALEGLPAAARVMRRARGLNLRDAAAAAGVPFNTFARLERDQDCSIRNAIKLLRWLDETPEPPSTEETEHQQEKGPEDE